MQPNVHIECGNSRHNTLIASGLLLKSFSQMVPLLIEVVISDLCLLYLSQEVLSNMNSLSEEHQSLHSKQVVLKTLLLSFYGTLRKGVDILLKVILLVTLYLLLNVQLVLSKINLNI